MLRSHEMTESTPPSVLAKAALILDVLGDAGVAGVSELARRTGLAKTTVNRTANELVAVGLVERAGDGYRLGVKLFELGSRVPGRRQFREAALPFLEDLSHATNQTTHLAVVDETDVVYVERLVGHRSNEVPSSVADRLPLHCTATGKCILAFGADEHLIGLSAEPLEARTPASITDYGALVDHLDTVRADGVAREVGEVVEGLRSTAAPVLGQGGTLVGALSVTGPIDGFDDGRIEPLVRLAAAGLSRRLGFD